MVLGNSACARAGSGRERDLRTKTTIYFSRPRFARAGEKNEPYTIDHRHWPSFVVCSVSLVSATKMASSFAGSVVLAFSLMR
jgi:hypothetical protein